MNAGFYVLVVLVLIEKVQAPLARAWRVWLETEWDLYVGRGEVRDATPSAVGELVIWFRNRKVH